MVEVHLRPSSYTSHSSNTDLVGTVFDSKTGQRRQATEADEIVGEVVTSPMERRSLEHKELLRNDGRPHAVCTVQTFKNKFSGKFSLFFFLSLCIYRQNQ